MASQTSTVSSATSSSSTKSGTNINDGIDSAFRADPAHRGSLTPPELDSIHQTNSFKQALKLQKQDNRELAARKKSIEEDPNHAQVQTAN